jgi:hypothetical protein
MYVKNSVTIEFVTDRPLTEGEVNQLKAILCLQIEEPQDFDGNDEEWTASDITTHHNAIVREG